MIEEYTLAILCDKYNISKDKIIKKNNNILTFGEFNDIDNTLNYLINDLKIAAYNIEKCPSILYRNVNEIQKNVEFLKKTNISFSNVESCLHVLSTDNEQLVETYNYVKSEYGIDAINKNTSILSCSLKIIHLVEKLNLKKEYNLTISVAIQFGYTNLDEIQKIIYSEEYKTHPELFTSQTLTYGDINQIIGLINTEEFSRFEKIITSECIKGKKYVKEKFITKVNLAYDYGIPEENLTAGYFFNTTVEQLYAILQYLRDNKINVLLDGKLHPMLKNKPNITMKQYNVDIKQLQIMYPLIEKYNYKGRKENVRNR